MSEAIDKRAFLAWVDKQIIDSHQEEIKAERGGDIEVAVRCHVRKLAYKYVSQQIREGRFDTNGATLTTGQEIDFAHSVLTAWEGVSAPYDPVTVEFVRFVLHKLAEWQK